MYIAELVVGSYFILESNVLFVRFGSHTAAIGSISAVAGLLAATTGASVLGRGVGSGPIVAPMYI